jgi:hypothetical protein
VVFCAPVVLNCAAFPSVMTPPFCADTAKEPLDEVETDPPRKLIVLLAPLATRPSVYTTQHLNRRVGQAESGTGFCRRSDHVAGGRRRPYGDR